MKGRSPLWWGIFAAGVVYAVASGHWGSLVNLALRVA